VKASLATLGMWGSKNVKKSMRRSPIKLMYNLLGCKNQINNCCNLFSLIEYCFQNWFALWWLCPPTELQWYWSEDTGNHTFVQLAWVVYQHPRITQKSASWVSSTIFKVMVSFVVFSVQLLFMLSDRHL
jgi:hypothetical protein